MTDQRTPKVAQRESMEGGEAAPIQLPTDLQMVHDVPPTQSVARRAVQRKTKQSQAAYAVASTVLLVLGGWLLADFFLANMSPDPLMRGSRYLYVAIPSLVVGYLLRIKSRQP